MSLPYLYPSETDEEKPPQVRLHLQMVYLPHDGPWTHYTNKAF